MSPPTTTTCAIWPSRAASRCCTWGTTRTPIWKRSRAVNFPPDLSIDPIRYEFHQPPLYYALAAPIYGLTGGDPFSLRLFSVALGAGIVLLAYAIARRVFPARPALALGTAAFVAFLPQHLATVAQIGNDVLAELLYAAVLFVLVGWLTQPANQ